MIATRLLILLATLALGMGSLWVLPMVTERPAPGISMDLPDELGGFEWIGREEAVSQKEIDILGPGTRFARKSYTNARGEQIYVSIVLAGDDMNTSIHRPEWCLPAQGYTIVQSAPSEVAFDDKKLTAMRLLNRRDLPVSRTKKVVEHSLDYYWFIGSKQTTHLHRDRNLIDIRDRFLYGHNQPWAFIMVIAQIGEGIRPSGKNEAQTDVMIREFMAELIPKITDPALDFN